LDKAAESAKNGARGDFDACLRQAGKFLKELMATLNLELEASERLMKTYLYANKLIVSAPFCVSPDDSAAKVAAARDVISAVSDAFKQIKHMEPNLPDAPDAPKLTAGLTYTKDGELSEIVSEGGREYEA
jgi:flagellin-specific chaperone FliS